MLVVALAQHAVPHAAEVLLDGRPFRVSQQRFLGRGAPRRRRAPAAALKPQHGVTAADWRSAIAGDPYFAASETPCFVGRAVAALAADPEVARKAGGLYSSWGLAEEYGFTDLDGSRPDFGRHLAEHGGPPGGPPRTGVSWRLERTGGGTKSAPPPP